SDVNGSPTSTTWSSVTTTVPGTSATVATTAGSETTPPASAVMVADPSSLTEVTVPCSSTATWSGVDELQVKVAATWLPSASSATAVSSALCRSGVKSWPPGRISMSTMVPDELSSPPQASACATTRARKERRRADAMHPYAQGAGKTAHLPANARNQGGGGSSFVCSVRSQVQVSVCELPMPSSLVGM